MSILTVSFLIEGDENIFGYQQGKSKVEDPGDDGPYFNMQRDFFVGVVVDQVDAEHGQDAKDKNHHHFPLLFINLNSIQIHSRQKTIIHFFSVLKEITCLDLLNFYSTMSKFTNLIKVARKGDTDKLLEMLDEGKYNINEVDPKSGMGLIHIGVENDDNQLLTALFNRPGIDLQLTTLEGESPLEMAVRLNNPWIVGKLMDMNVNFKRKNSQRETVLHIALKNQTHKDILKRLTAKIDINEPIDEFGSYLNLAIISGHTDNFFFLIKELSLNYTKSFDSEGNTCLILAVQYNRGDFLVSILDKLAQDPLLTQIQRQFFINHQNNEGNTAIHEAVLNNLQTITQKLESVGKELGLDCSIRNRKGQTIEEIKVWQEKERQNEIEMEKRKQELNIIRQKEKKEEKIRKREQEERRQAEELRQQKEEEKRQLIQSKVNIEAQKKKTLWIMGILLVIVLAGMYLALTNAIEKKKPVTL